MSRTVSPSSDQPYGVARVAAVWNLARSSFYAARQRQHQPRESKKRGPKVHSDEELVGEIRQLLAEPFSPEKVIGRSGLACVTGACALRKTAFSGC